jgi:hypothetical protein
MSVQIHLSECFSNLRIAWMEKIQLQYSYVNKMADCYYKLLSVMRNDWLILLKNPTDLDNAMENAIRALFPYAFHRFCRWYMLRKYKDQLNQMYDQHPKLNDKLISVINIRWIHNNLKQNGHQCVMHLACMIEWQCRHCTITDVCG